MKILLLSCSTGEGHNHCALAVKEALDARGHETSSLDMLHMFGDPGPLSFDKILNRISTKAPDVFGMMYHAGAMYSATGVTSPVYMATSATHGSSTPSSATTVTTPLSARTCSRWKRSRSCAGGSAAR